MLPKVLDYLERDFLILIIVLFGCFNYCPYYV